VQAVIVSLAINLLIQAHRAGVRMCVVAFTVGTTTNAVTVNALIIVVHIIVAADSSSKLAVALRNIRSRGHS